MAGNSSVVNIEVRVDDKGGVVLRQLGESARTSASQAEGAFKKTGASLEDMNRRLADSVTTLGRLAKAAIGFLAVRETLSGLWNAMISLSTASWEAESAQIRLNSALSATGGAAGFGTAQLVEFAGRLQDLTSVSDDVIIAGMAILATFKNVRGEAFGRTTKAALDLTANLNDGVVSAEGLKGSMLQLGKALNDPLSNLGALSRAGVQFTEKQEEMIKALWNAGKAAEAQDIILRELETTVGGTADALGKGAGGAARLATENFGDLREEIGRFLVKSPDMEAFLRAVAQAFKDATAWVRENQNALADWVKTGVVAAVDGIENILRALKYLGDAWNWNMSYVLAAKKVYLEIMAWSQEGEVDEARKKGDKSAEKEQLRRLQDLHQAIVDVENALVRSDQRQADSDKFFQPLFDWSGKLKDNLKGIPPAVNDAMQAFADFKALERKANGEVVGKTTTTTAGGGSKTAEKEAEKRRDIEDKIRQAELKADEDFWGAKREIARLQAASLERDLIEAKNPQAHTDAERWLQAELSGIDKAEGQARAQYWREWRVGELEAEQASLEEKIKLADGLARKQLEVDLWAQREKIALAKDTEKSEADRAARIVQIDQAAASMRTKVEAEEAARRAKVEADYQGQIADLIRGSDQVKAAELTYKSRMAALDEWYAQEKKINADIAVLDELYALKRREITEESFNAMALAGDDFAAGMAAAFKDLGKAAYTFGQAGYEAVKEFAQAGEQLMSDVFVAGMKGELDNLTDAWRSFTDSIIRMFADAFAQMAMQEIVLPSLSGDSGSGGLGKGLFDQLFSIFNDSGSAKGDGYAGGGTWEDIFSNTPGTGGPSAQPGQPGGGAMQNIGAGFAGYGAGSMLWSAAGSMGLVEDNQYTQTGGMLGAAVGGMIGAIWGPVGAAVGALIGTLLGSLIGSFMHEGAKEDLDLTWTGSGPRLDHKGDRKSYRFGYGIGAGDFGQDYGSKLQGEKLEQATIAFMDDYYSRMEDAFDLDMASVIKDMELNWGNVQDKLDGAQLSDLSELMLRKVMREYVDDFKSAVASSSKGYATTLVSGFEDIVDGDQLKEWLDRAMEAITLAEEMGRTISDWMQDYGLTLGGMLSELPNDVSQKFQDLYGALFEQRTGMDKLADDMNAQFDTWVNDLKSLGVDEAFLAGIEAVRQDIIDAMIQAAKDEFNLGLDQRELSALNRGGEATVIARQAQQQSELDAAIERFGEGSAEVARLTRVQTLENERLAASMAETIEAMYAAAIGNQEGAAWAALQSQHAQTWQQAIAAGVSDADLARLEEAMRIENELFALQWEFAKRERTETLQIRMLRAQGLDDEADALENQIEHERELLQARLDGWSAEDMAMLRQVQAAEDAQRAQEEAAAAAKEYADAIARANDRFSDFRSSIQDWLNSKLVEESPATSPQSRLEAAQDQFWTTYQKAMNGDWQAAESMTGMADTYLAALEAMYGSTAQYQQGYQDVIAAMQALPNQKLYEAAVLEELKNITSTTGTTATNTGDTAAAVDSIPAELRTKLQEAIEAADVDYSGGMNSTEFQKYYENNKDLLSKLMGGVSGKSVGELFKILDGDGDGQITPLEIENYTGAAGQDADLQAARELTTNQMLAAHAVQLTALVHNTAVTAGAKGWEGTGWTNPFADSALMNYWPTRNSWIKALAGYSEYARADGGPVWPGQPFLVGEEGPEFFIPRTSGTILDAATSRGLAGNVAGGDMGLPILRELQGMSRILEARLDQSARETEELKDELKDLAGEVRELKKATRTAAERRAVK
jgi:hypothetical protein